MYSNGHQASSQDSHYDRHHRRAHLCGMAGFTLIEMLVALSIGAGIALMAYQAMSGAINIEARVTKVNQMTNDVARVWQLLSDDFQHSVARPWADSFSNVQPAMSGLLGDRLSQSSIASAGEDTHLIRFVRSGEKNFFKQARSNMQIVGYRITVEEEDEQAASSDDKEKGKISLWRDYWRPIDSVGEPTIKSRRILDNIKTIQFRYLPQTTETIDDQAWVNGWPESETQQALLPIAVEVSIDVDGLGEVLRLFPLTVTESPDAQ